MWTQKPNYQKGVMTDTTSATPVAPVANEAAPAADTAKEINKGKEPVSSEASAEKAQARKLKAIVDGAELEVDEAEVLKDYQKYKSADKRFQEAAQMRKQVEEFISSYQPILEALPKLQEDPGAIHRLLGMDFEDIAYQTALKKALAEYENENLSPQEKELRSIKAELEAFKKEKELERKRQEESLKEQEEAKKQRLELEAAEKLDSEISSAISELGVKATPRLIARMAEEMVNYLDAHGELLPAKEALNRVRGEMKGFSPSELAKLLPEDILDALVQERAGKKVSKPLTTPKQVESQPSDSIDEELSKFFKTR